MARKKKDDFVPMTATTPEGRERQLVALAYDLAERQIREGTASSQTINHFLKLGSTRERVEREYLESRSALAFSKKEMIDSTKSLESLYTSAIEAMRRYSGNYSEEDE